MRYRASETDVSDFATNEQLADNFLPVCVTTLSFILVVYYYWQNSHGDAATLAVPATVFVASTMK